MFLKCSTRNKDGQEHRSWSVVESRRVGRGVVLLARLNLTLPPQSPPRIAVAKTN
jgi:hypothetical protein